MCMRSQHNAVRMFYIFLCLTPQHNILIDDDLQWKMLLLLLDEAEILFMMKKHKRLKVYGGIQRNYRILHISRFDYRKLIPSDSNLFVTVTNLIKP